MTPQEIAKAITDLHLGPSETFEVARLMGVVCRDEAMAFAEFEDKKYAAFKKGYWRKGVLPSQHKGLLTIEDVYSAFNAENSKEE